MSDMAAENSSASDPKAGKPRPKSGVSFPYYSLSKSIEAVRQIHEKAGGRCSRSQLASLLGYSGVVNGGFLTRISAAKMFGLIEEYSDTIVLTERAKSILSSTKLAEIDHAKVDAFLSVDLYQRVFEQYDGQNLPGEAGLKSVLENHFKVVPKQVDPALRNLLDSADTAGFFRVAGNRSRMVKPIIHHNPPDDVLSSETSAVQPQDVHAPEEPHRGRNPSRHKTPNAGGDDGAGIDPALIGLLRNLPPPGEKLGPKRRQALIEAFKSTINFIYPEDED